jgi:hypothetical protein
VTKDPRVYLAHILECVQKIERFTADGKGRFLRDAMVQDAVLRIWKLRLSVLVAGFQPAKKTYMNFRRLNAATSSGVSANHSPLPRRSAKRRCQYASMPTGSSVLMTWTVVARSGSWMASSYSRGRRRSFARPYSASRPGGGRPRRRRPGSCGPSARLARRPRRQGAVP